MNNSIVYALDFDGVICDSAVETAITGWRAARMLWTNMPEPLPQVMVKHFLQIRPVIETGFESILAMRLLYLGETVEAIYRDYAGQSQALIQQLGVTDRDLKKLFGETRDAWIDTDLSGWIAMNPLFDGVAAKLQKLGQRVPWYIITTKQERFVKRILKAHAVELPEERIFGLDRNMSKPEILKELIKVHPERQIYFVEDRLPALMKVFKDDALIGVKLILAMWGYNTDDDKAMAAQLAFCRLQLENFLEI